MRHLRLSRWWRCKLRSWAVCGGGGAIGYQRFRGPCYLHLQGLRTFTLKMEAPWTPETLVSYHNTEDLDMNIRKIFDWNTMENEPINSSSEKVYEGVSKSFRTESITKYTLTIINTRSEATQRIMAAKLNILTHKIAIQLHLVAESCTVCSSRSRRPVRKLLDTHSTLPRYCMML
jgi:hypothetical protein